MDSNLLKPKLSYVEVLDSNLVRTLVIMTKIFVICLCPVSQMPRYHLD
jgi:hypothetical protein